MKILLIGSGGREHALAVRMLQDPGVNQVLVYPGNPGMKFTPNIFTCPDLEITFEKALAIVRQENVSLVVIGPEWPLYQGWVDRFECEGVAVFGPTKSAAILEESKIFAKQFMLENHIPTARFEVAKSLNATINIIRSHPEWSGYVLKLSGPAQGKGVIVVRTADEAVNAAKDFFKFNPAGIEDGILVEEIIQGREVSLFYVCMGEEFQFLTSACDHKRLLENDEGPNTGGMGAYSPAYWVDSGLLGKVEKLFVIPTLRGMKMRGTPFKGVLFLGLMVQDENPYLLEYNTRFGDPESQAILPRVEGNFTSLLLACSKNDEESFRNNELKTSHLHSLHLVKVSRGYPGLFGEKIDSGKVISLSISSTPNEQLYFAGVSELDGKLVTSGGRVLGLTVLSHSMLEVQKLAYQRIHQATFEGEQFRTDIGVSR